MAKLATPVQYESVLEGLNALRPLQLVEPIRRTVDVPILNSLPIESVKSAAGTLAKGTQQGAILNKNIYELTEYEKIEYNSAGIAGNINIEFAQTVKHIAINMRQKAGSNPFYWCIPLSNVMLRDITELGMHQLEFVGTKMWFYQNALPFHTLIFNAYGFY